eukprot:3113400-Prorocentrum_lima.AAC.1
MGAPYQNRVSCGAWIKGGWAVRVLYEHPGHGADAIAHGAVALGVDTWHPLQCTPLGCLGGCGG